MAIDWAWGGGRREEATHRNGAVLPARLDIIVARRVDAGMDLPGRSEGRSAAASSPESLAVRRSVQVSLPGTDALYF